MALNIHAYLSSQFTPTVVDQLGERLGEKPANVGAAIAAAIPTLLGTLVARTQSTGDADALVDVLRQTKYSQEATPFDIGQVTDTAAETQSAIAGGSDFVQRLLSTRVDEVARQIAAHSHVNRASAVSLLDLVGSVLEGILGRQVLDNGLTGFNLSTLMAGQIDEVRANMPAGLASLATTLGFAKLPHPSGDEAQGITTFTSTPSNPDIPKSPLVERERENVSWLRWAMIAVGALILFLIVQKCREPQTATDGIYTDTTARAESDRQEDTSAATRQNIAESNASTQDTARGPFDNNDSTASSTAMPVLVQVELPGGRRLKVAERSFNANLAQFLAGKTRPVPRTFTFENLTFDTNSARITTESQPNVNDLIEIMKAYPGLQINIQGHTDNTGNADTNRKLSIDRANAVRSALIAADVAADRVTAQGFGAEKPTASNDTAEGRQKNRRIDVVVLKL
ncbi:OmpA/MotB domain protein [Fibrella aestuarina BUZ 2]|uniref:OmpA/MotB domain protein n=1 Tax=Fibrella aestuarina BUZ 2 TaxID=1166018 RepID=I0KA21_9BACT|nr:OmpA family protein [Fibrella aestuarina]CCH00974.1 OmpA/MotB domain protein [Fibrella aestuarina BUZ 2]